MGRPARTEADRELMKQMGERLRWVREAKGWSQQQIATFVGLDQTAWSLYERGLRWPDQFAAARLIAKLKISREYLLDGLLDDRVEPALAIRLGAAHPELVPPIRKGNDKDKDQDHNNLRQN
jgi:transcriptional regulator with XRE-family HTH domain